MSWVSWKKLSTSKSQGGLGFRELLSFNQSLLANQIWKLSQRPNCLVYRALKHRYFRNNTICNAKTGYHASFGWKSLLYGRQLLDNGLQSCIGDGASTPLSDKWLPMDPPRAPKLLPYTNPLLSVQTLINIPGNQWEEEALYDLVEQQDHNIIRKIFLPPLRPPDTKAWMYNNDGNYSACSGYSFLNRNQDRSLPLAPLALHPDLSRDIWKLDTQPKLHHFIWRLLSGALAVKTNLRTCRINADPYCFCCCVAEESKDHLYFTCPYAQYLWRLSGVSSDSILDTSTS